MSVIVSPQSPAYQVDNLTSILGASGIDVTGPVQTFSYINGAVFLEVSGTVANYGFPLGPLQNFGRLKFTLNAWDAAHMPTTIRMRILTVNDAGTVLWDSYQVPVIGLSTTTSPTVTFDFPNIANAAGTQLWCQLLADGYFSPLSTNGMFTYPVYYTYNNASTAQVRSATPSLPSTSVSANNVSFVAYTTNFVTVQNSWINGTGALGTNLTYTPIYNPTGSPFYGWGTPIGIRAPFNYLTFAFQCFSNTTAVPLPTTVQIVIKDSGSPSANTNGYAGTVVASISYSLLNAQGISSVQPLTPTEVSIILPDGVASGNQLWLEIYLDTNVEFWVLPPPTPLDTTYTTARNAQTNQIGGSTFALSTVSGTQRNLWVQTANVNLQAARIGTPSVTNTLIRAIATQIWEPLPLNPRNFYGLTGYEMPIFFDSITGYPPTREGSFNPPYRWQCGCSKGVHYADRYVYTPSDGDTAIALTVTPSWGGVPYAPMQSTLNFSQLNSSTHNRQLNIAGDSLIGGAGTAMLAELTRIFALIAAGGGATFTMIGANTGQYCTSPGLTAGNNSLNVSVNTYCEGWPGETAAFFYTGLPTNGSYNSGHGPFYYSGAFNYATYLSTNSLTMNSGDWFVISDGGNEIQFANPTQVLAAYLQAVDGMIANVKSVVSGVRIAIDLPSRYTGQDGVAQEFSSALTGVDAVTFSRNRDALVAGALAHYDTAAQNAAGIYVIPSYCQIDPINDFDYTQVVNGQYDMRTRQVPNNGIHYANRGLWRRAAQWAAFFNYMN